jgi:PKD domain/Calx-beta domain
MRSRSVFVCLVLASFVAAGARAECPVTAPGVLVIEAFPFHCRENAACPQGGLTLTLQGLVPPGLPNPGTYQSYRIQPCDVVEWSFGDGETTTLTGSERVGHKYAAPGNYAIQAKVTNQLGSIMVQYEGGRPVVIATSPSQLSVATTTNRFTLPGGRDTECSNCVVVREDVGVATIPVLRSLDLSRTVSADVMVLFDNTWVPLPVTFLPGETQKNVTVQVPNDGIYSGYRVAGLRFGNASGGTLTNVTHTQVAIIDDDPAPTMSIEPHFEVKEGHTGITVANAPVHLSSPMGASAAANTFCEDRSATWGEDFYCGYDLYIPPGATVGGANLQILGDKIPERDKTFRVRIASRANPSPEFAPGTCLVTILNDDAALSPARTDVRTGSPFRLTLDIGSAYAVPTKAKFISSAPGVVPAPETVVIPAGATTVEVVGTARAAGSARITALLPGRSANTVTIMATAAASPRRRAAGH